MLSTLNKDICVKLTAEQIEAIKAQTGLGYVPETVSLPVDILVEGQRLHGASDRDLDAGFGLIHEINRT